MNTLFKNKYNQSITLILCVLFGFFLNFILEKIYSRENNVSDHTIRQTSEYKLISPLLICGSNIDDREYTSLEFKIKNEVSKDIYANKAKDISVYFRDLLGSKNVTVEENKQYAPASLLKVPLMIAYYKKAEENPNILSKQIFFNNSLDNNEQEVFKSPYGIVEGWYKVENLLKAMIVNSDNNATMLLDENIDEETKDNIYKDLGISLPKDYKADDNYITAKQYSYFFRILFNSTYLRPEYSEKALELLTGPDFPQGIKSSIPDSVTVAQKFGERTIVNLSTGITTRELHDCGIVYYPNKPFILCIMTRGNDFGKLLDIIKSISKITYSEISKH